MDHGFWPDFWYILNVDTCAGSLLLGGQGKSKDKEKDSKAPNFIGLG